MNLLKRCYDAAAGFYGRSADRDWQERFSRLRKTVRDTLATADLEVAADARILDLGCGTGLAAEEFLRRHPQTGQVIGVDLSPHMGEAAKKNLGAKFTFCRGDYADPALWPTLPERFQGVLAFYTLHWTRPEDLALVIERISGVLDGTGWLVGISMGPGELGGIFHDTIPEILQVYLPPAAATERLNPWNPKDVAEIESALKQNGFTRTRTISLRFTIAYPTYPALLSVILFQYSFWLTGLPPELFPSLRARLLRSLAQDPRFAGRNGGVAAPHHIVIFEAHKR